MSDQQLIKENLQLREAASVHFDIQIRFDPSGECDNKCIDAYIAGLGLKKINKEWIELKRPEAELLLISLLHKDMAYNCECMPMELVNATARLFLDQFNESSKFFSNAEWQPNKSGALSIQSWNPITNATFDSGVVACDNHQIGLIWIEDED